MSLLVMRRQAHKSILCPHHRRLERGVYLAFAHTGHTDGGASCAEPGPEPEPEPELSGVLEG